MMRQQLVRRPAARNVACVHGRRRSGRGREWSVMPQVVAAPNLRIVDVLIVAGSAGGWFLIAGRAVASAPLVPINDPYLGASLARRQ